MPDRRVSLELLQVPEPCPADWNAMAGDDRARYCQGCQKFVHNLSAMSRDEAEKLVCSKAGELCIRMSRDAAGRVLTLDYKPIEKSRGWRFWTGIGLVGAIVGGLANLWFFERRIQGTTTVAGVLPIAAQQGGASTPPCLTPSSTAVVMGAVPPRPVIGNSDQVAGDRLASRPEAPTDPPRVTHSLNESQ